MKKLSFELFLLVILFGSIKAQETNKAVAFNPDSIKIVEMEPFSYVVIEMTGSYSQHNAAYTKLWEENTKQFLDYDEGFFAIYYNSPANTPEANLRWDVGTKLRFDEEVFTPLVKKKWDCKTIAKATYKGNFGAGLSDAYAKSHAWISQKGYRVNGAALQKHLDQARPNEKGELIGTVELWFPITK